jgi:hypothetical protein
MAHYYVNDAEEAEGYHEVHRSGCKWLPLIVSKTDLGAYDDCREAVKAAKKTYRKSNGCRDCSPDCHKA